MKRFILLLVTIVFLFTACSQKNTSNLSQVQISENDFNLSVEQEKRATILNFIVPEGLSLDEKKLPLVGYYDVNWCVTQKHFPNSIYKQFFIDDSDAYIIAGNLSKFTANNAFNKNYESWTFFDSINEANEEELLWVAVGNTPSIQLGVVYESFTDTFANDVKFSDETMGKTSLGELIVSAARQGVCITEVRYADDVKTTFNWLYGEDLPFKPQSLERFGWRYIEELGVFVTDWEMGTFIDSGVTQQIINIEKANDLYFVESVPSKNHINEEGIIATFDYPSGLLEITEDNKDELLQETHYFYKLKKGENGHFIVCGFRYD